MLFDGELAKIAHAQQGLIICPISLLQGGRTASIAQQIRLDAVRGELVPGKIPKWSLMGNGNVTDIGAEARTMCRHDAASANEHMAADGAHHECRVLLAHAERLAIHIFIDDEIADHRDAQTLQPVEQRQYVARGIAMPFQESGIEIEVALGRSGRILPVDGTQVREAHLA